MSRPQQRADRGRAFRPPEREVGHPRASERAEADHAFDLLRRGIAAYA